LIVFVVY